MIDLLAKHGVTPPVDSRVEHELLAPLEVMERARRARPQDISIELLAEAGGMYDLAAKLLSIAGEPEFATFTPHLRLFAKPALYTSSLQSKAGDPRDDAGRKLTELYVGALAVHFAHDVVLDHPQASQGDNPDVMFTTEDISGVRTRWAIAIKSIASRSGQTIFENILKASKQINAETCSAERGIVFIAARGSIDHASLWATPFPTVDSAIQALRSELRGLAELAERDRTEADWHQAFTGKTSPLFLLSGQAVVQVATEAGPVPTVLKMVLEHNPLERSDANALQVALNLNHFMQTIVKGIPGAPGQLPS
ncbi:hypothetical protein [Lysobacter sp. Root916]|uniref:hypothetical protein n=1 Tax=Lysobacter sp. Root916 TaxID=1736606 RepID=UPI001F3D5384|nr:hypothetical protein [Lysobacter sp. Root916]